MGEGKDRYIGCNNGFRHTCTIPTLAYGHYDKTYASHGIVTDNFCQETSIEEKALVAKYEPMDERRSEIAAC